jgi:hypothetical protein
MEAFADSKGSSVLSIYFRRKKTTLERQPGSVEKDGHGIMIVKPNMVLFWRIFFCIVVFILIVFFGVGVMATNSQFSPTFQKTFFWIAIIWTLVPTVILSWLVHAIGGNGKDVMSVFLASLAIWLVVIQVKYSVIGIVRTAKLTGYRLAKHILSPMLMVHHLNKVKSISKSVVGMAVLPQISITPVSEHNFYHFMNYGLEYLSSSKIGFKVTIYQVSNELIQYARRSRAK